MAAKKRGLGRGLDALLGPAKVQTRPVEAETAPSAVDVDSAAAHLDGQLRTLGVEQLQRGKYQPRIDMHKESLQDLADSISEQG